MYCIYSFYTTLCYCAITQHRYVNVFGEGGYNAGVGKGHEDHYIESHELADNKNGTFRRRVYIDNEMFFLNKFFDILHTCLSCRLGGVTNMEALASITMT